MEFSTDSRSKAIRDIVIAVGVTLGVFSLSVGLGLTERWLVLIHDPQDILLEEIVLGLGLVTIAFAWYVFRRSQEYSHEVGRRKKINDLLVREIMERRAVEAALRGEEAKLRAVTENAPFLIVLKDLQGRYQFVNHMFEEWWGVKGADVIGLTAHDVLPESFAKRSMTDDQMVIKTGRVVRHESDVNIVDGRCLRVAITKFPVFSTDGKVIGVGNVNTDMTSYRDTEQQLRQAQKMEVLGQLTGGIAHDFNNLLAVIMGNSELLSDTLPDDDDKTRRRIEALTRAAKRGAELTQRLLAFSRLQPLQPKPLNLADLIGDMAEILRRTLGEQIEVTIDSDADLWPALADPGQVENALLNLAINAQHAMPRGGALLVESRNVTLGEDYINKHHEAVSGDYVMLAVTDNGNGMSPDVLQHVFEPFYTTKDRSGGSGLGLSMVYGFAQQSGGHVTLESEEGVGTTARLYLPRTRRAIGPSHAAPEEGSALGGGETVLVVEDEADVRAMAAAMLTDMGYQVLTASYGMEAENILSGDNKIDVLLSDMVLMGGMSGVEVAEAARRYHPHIKVLFMSGYMDRDELHSPSRIEGAILLEKPFRKADLASRLRELLNRIAADEDENIQDVDR